ncbi:MAG: hypothetical protein N2V78_09355 [Methanophagales archaeon]|nr:hypothetical protein [Methanophagales archaeon]
MSNKSVMLGTTVPIEVYNDLLKIKDFNENQSKWIRDAILAKMNKKAST